MISKRRCDGCGGRWRWSWDWTVVRWSGHVRVYCHRHDLDERDADDPRD